MFFQSGWTVRPTFYKPHQTSAFERADRYKLHVYISTGVEESLRFSSNYGNIMLT